MGIRKWLKKNVVAYIMNNLMADLRSTPFLRHTLREHLARPTPVAGDTQWARHSLGRPRHDDGCESDTRLIEIKHKTFPCPSLTKTSTLSTISCRVGSEADLTSLVAFHGQIRSEKM